MIEELPSRTRKILRNAIDILSPIFQEVDIYTPRIVNQILLP